MFSICKTAVRGVAVLSVLTGLAAGGTLLLAGPDRAKALFEEFRTDVVETIDQSIGDPAAMRQELIDLEKEYPKRIAQVRGDLAQLNEQIRQLDHERKISEQVVALADRDLAELESAISVAEEQLTSTGNPRTAVVRFAGGVYEVERAKSRAHQIRQIRSLHSGTAADSAHDLTYLQSQAQRLEDLSTELSTERAEFQSQISMLARQVDAIERNDRLIDLLEERNKTIEECSRFDTASVDHVTQRLAEIRSRQEAELEILSSTQETLDYEEMARDALDEIEVETSASDRQGSSLTLTSARY